MLQRKPHKTTLACAALKSMATYGKLLLPTSVTVWEELFLASVCLSVCQCYTCSSSHQGVINSSVVGQQLTSGAARGGRGKLPPYGCAER